jgi:hypothetical protein
MTVCGKTLMFEGKLRQPIKLLEIVTVEHDETNFKK